MPGAPAGGRPAAGAAARAHRRGRRRLHRRDGRPGPGRRGRACWRSTPAAPARRAGTAWTRWSPSTTCRWPSTGWPPPTPTPGCRRRGSSTSSRCAGRAGTPWPAPSTSTTGPATTPRSPSASPGCYAWSGADHPHVHGANLSLSAAAYVAVGGLPPLALAEDHALVAALEGRGLRVARSATRPVRTSARPDPRCDGRLRRAAVRARPPVASPGVTGPQADLDTVLVVDFGAQYAQLIARRVRECHVYSEVVPHTITAQEIRARAPKAVILSGGPSSVYAEGAPQVAAGFFDTGVPTFGICYGFQAMAASLGGTVARTGTAEFGRTALAVVDPGVLFSGLPGQQSVWMSHGDAVVRRAARVRRHRVDAADAGGGVRGHRPRAVRRAVPPRGAAQRARPGGARALPARGGRLPARPGRWSTSSRTRSPRSARRSATSGWSAGCPAASTPRSRRRSCSARSATS